jgi:hypothetical protein
MKFLVCTYDLDKINYFCAKYKLLHRSIVCFSQPQYDAEWINYVPSEGVRFHNYIFGSNLIPFMREFDKNHKYYVFCLQHPPQFRPSNGFHIDSLSYMVFEDLLTQLLQNKFKNNGIESDFFIINDRSWVLFDTDYKPICFNPYMSDLLEAVVK